MARFAKTLCLLVLGLPFALGASTAGLALVGCSGGGQGGGTGGGGGKDGGVDGGGESDAFNLFTLDDAARELLWFSMSVDPGTERVGVAYFTPSSTTSVGGDGGTERNYDLKYVEWNNGIASAPERIRSMQRMVGLSLAFDPLSHQAVTTFLGGDPQFVVGKSIFWYQNDLAVARRTMAGTWVESDVVTTSAPPRCSHGAAPSTPAFSRACGRASRSTRPARCMSRIATATTASLQCKTGLRLMSRSSREPTKRRWAARVDA